MQCLQNELTDCTEEKRLRCFAAFFLSASIHLSVHFSLSHLLFSCLTTSCSLGGERSGSVQCLHLYYRLSVCLTQTHTHTHTHTHIHRHTNTHTHTHTQTHTHTHTHTHTPLQPLEQCQMNMGISASGGEQPSAPSVQPSSVTLTQSRA